LSSLGVNLQNNFVANYKNTTEQ